MSKFINNLALSLTSARLLMSQEEYNKLFEDLKKFIAENKQEPVENQAKLFIDRYGKMVEAASYGRLIGIDKGIQSIKTILIATLIVIPIIAAILMAIVYG